MQTNHQTGPRSSAGITSQIHHEPLQPVKISEAHPLDVPDIEELLEAIRSAQFEEEGSRP